ncbi:uncharacterized protein LOC116569010 [Mustela erminea]|uniref:uncharacterized protein LOC116569010 n=1 Tax=Mustela erminea TaxID=36723 RepID=UPI0013872E31|nr:uncharacterized protein LOC116569010 [Mustela erminea]
MLFTQLIGQLLRLTWELYNPVLTASGQTHSRLNVLQASLHLLSPAPPLPHPAPPSPSADTQSLWAPKALEHVRTLTFPGSKLGVGGRWEWSCRDQQHPDNLRARPREMGSITSRVPFSSNLNSSSQSTRTKKAQENGEGEGHRLLTSKGDKHCSKKKIETELQEDSREESESTHGLLGHSLRLRVSPIPPHPRVAELRGGGLCRSQASLGPESIADSHLPFARLFLRREFGAERTGSEGQRPFPKARSFSGEKGVGGG